ncbi:hypothetical protein HU762_22270 [Pseudomonas sp. SWRI92]|uniref:hypothetical protein n=1 Tax=Pseudomonas sp. SWRI92 TaxID=2745499 RepID=UPI001645E809|nr:hypothetical protein [Pseudomonas sp. SWRI92]MBC3376671.1 hypothetical protein [Pseudomonas sp. SWRI92]
MREEHSERSVDQATDIALWHALLRDEAALLAHAGSHHKMLLAKAYAMHRNLVIDRDDLSDLLEQADGALAYAIEALFDRQLGESAD